MSKQHLGILFASLLLWACGDDVVSTGSGAGGGATSSSSSAGNTGGAGGMAAEKMGASMACQQCVGQLYGSDPACMNTIQNCDADPGCDAWKNCNEDCFNEDDSVACYAACEESFPHDTSLSQPLLDCTCNACDSLCVASCT